MKESMKNISESEMRAIVHDVIMDAMRYDERIANIRNGLSNENHGIRVTLGQTGDFLIAIVPLR